MICCTYSAIRKTAFEYHSGLDMMTKEVKSARKNKIFNSKFKQIECYEAKCFLTRAFFDAKSDEIVSIFSGGPSITISDLVNTLNTVSPIEFKVNGRT
jgi:hypothetical protein